MVKTTATSGERKAWFLVGPTGVGKTETTHTLARRMNADILSADSMMVYRGMDIGTAKPTTDERQGIRYWGIDLAEPQDDFSVAQYLDHAKKAFDQGNRIIVTGGTGLYVKCLLQGLDKVPPAISKVRKEAEERLERGGVTALQDWLRELDPARLDGLADPNNPRRLVRAIEMASAGVEYPKTNETDQDDPMIVGLKMQTDLLHDRISKRIERMYEDGLLDEVRRLVENGPLSKSASQAIGYAEALDVLDGNLTEEQARERTALRTRKFAKRQMTWFRHQLNVEWVEVDESMTQDAIADRVESLWEKYDRVRVAV